MTAESSIAGTTSDEFSDYEDSQPIVEIKERPFKKIKKPKTELQRKLQQVYDKKSRNNKRARHHAMSGSFVPVLKEFVELVHYRIMKTENQINLLCLAKKAGSSISNNVTAQRQLDLNHGALKCIQSTAEDWRKRKSGESGRCFLKNLSIEIQLLLENLQTLGDQLRVATNELQWRLEDTTIGVWV
ncbi:uncharacterized protein PHALS_01695 [Plasmopara halstedii]|uniref:Uncharacterized protein n=1 Tax=Plasmopara halstedii TaxID=4781 RepID=A0A0P1ATB1_PLAHL|nr:uncharacterized protein PHALS_01695 [Plasmopara halstedii]CEG45396.1 hypothetical protein PHALS_01695 [Plasmopara halstedii]|eukprot:XP_024581765.1 hypothetical protein PHALS_01695 [Plasmopara halstedii]